MDLRRSRELVLQASEAGASLARLYVDVVRPGLERAGGGRLHDGATPAQRVVLGSVEASLAAVASRPMDGAGMHGEGRQALVSVGSAPLDALDGQVVVDVLCGDGWSVTEVGAGAAAEKVAARATELHVQLVVTPTAKAADLLLSASTYTELRRIPDPPLIVACAFGRPDDTRRARALGADAFVSDPDDLLRLVQRRLPARRRNWGVRLRRLGETLVVAPTGDLDDGSVRRLRDVVESRSGSFASLVVDTRDVASVSGAGMDALIGWLRLAGGPGCPHRVLPGPLFDAAVGGPAIDPTLIAVPADAGA